MSRAKNFIYLSHSLFCSHNNCTSAALSLDPVCLSRATDTPLTTSSSRGSAPLRVSGTSAACSRRARPAERAISAASQPVLRLSARLASQPSPSRLSDSPPAQLPRSRTARLLNLVARLPAHADAGLKLPGGGSQLVKKRRGVRNRWPLVKRRSEGVHHTLGGALVSGSQGITVQVLDFVKCETLHLVRDALISEKGRAISF